jgi:hypothetical protein
MSESVEVPSVYYVNCYFGNSGDKFYAYKSFKEHQPAEKVVVQGRNGLSVVTVDNMTEPTEIATAWIIDTVDVKSFEENLKLVTPEKVEQT